MADITTNPASLADAIATAADELPREQTDDEAWLAHAHAPGDPPPPRLSHADVGTD